MSCKQNLCQPCKYKPTCTSTVQYCNRTVLNSCKIQIPKCKCVQCEYKPTLSITVKNPCNGAIIRQKSHPIKEQKSKLMITCVPYNRCKFGPKPKQCCRKCKKSCCECKNCCDTEKSSNTA